MGNFQGGGNRGGGGGFHGGNGGGKPPFKKSWGGAKSGGDRGDVTMHTATCSECGKSCQVPFRPTGDKPVYCNDCFSGKKESMTNDRGPRRDFNDRGPKNFDRPQSRPDFNRPTAAQQTGAGHEEMKKHMTEIHAKLDRLVSAIEKLAVHGRDAIMTPKAAAPAPKAMPEVKKAPIAKVVVAEKKTPNFKTAVKKVLENKAPVAKKAVKKVAHVTNDTKHAKKDFAVKHPPALKPKNKRAK